MFSTKLSEAPPPVHDQHVKMPVQVGLKQTKQNGDLCSPSPTNLNHCALPQLHKTYCHTREYLHTTENAMKSTHMCHCRHELFTRKKQMLVRSKVSYLLFQITLLYYYKSKDSNKGSVPISLVSATRILSDAIAKNIFIANQAKANQF